MTSRKIKKDLTETSKALRSEYMSTRERLFRDLEKVQQENKEIPDLRVQIEKQKVEIRFYKDTRWSRNGAAMMLTCLGLLPLFFPEGLPVWARWICFGLVCIASTSYFWGWKHGCINIDDI